MTTSISLSPRIVTTRRENIDFQKLNIRIAENIESFLKYFGITYVVYPNRVSISCPIHGSSKNESLSIFTDGSTSKGNFVCWTHHCEEGCGRGATNFIKSVLKINGENDSIPSVIKLVEKITGSSVDMIGSGDYDIQKFNRLVSNITKETPNQTSSITRQYVRDNLIIPAEYYVERGYSRETLSYFDVGLCTTRGQQMFMRVVVPVYDITGKFMIGCCGRTLNNRCVICGKYHYKNNMCPTTKLEESWANKWINSKGFKSGHTLYNLWNASSIAIDKQHLILVEGPGDVWKLHECGIHNSMALFGCKITESQVDIIESLGITNISLALDSDSEGSLGRDRIIKRLENYYNLNVIGIPQGYKDIGEMSNNEVKNIFR